jgi:hypothetical protein
VTGAAVLALPIALAIAIGWRLLRRALARRDLLAEEVALAAAWVFIVASFVWLAVYLDGATLLGFGAPWTWITASHFAVAGFGALTVTALTCRAVSDARALVVLRLLLAAHPIAYLVTAAGILGFPYCDELGAAGYQIIFVAQLGAFALGRPDRIARGPRRLLSAALAVPVITMLPAIAWAWGHPMFDLDGMVRYHGIVNAIGHVGLALTACAWGRAPSHSPIRRAGDRPVQ